MVKITEQVAEKRLGNVESEKEFWCHDGIYVKNLRELVTALEKMSDDTFNYHVNESKNDFSKWVRDIIGDEKLSRDLAKNTNRIQAAKSVAARIGLLDTKVHN